MTRQDHLDAYRDTIAELQSILDEALNSTHPAKALIDSADRTSALSQLATAHLLVAKTLK